MAANQSPTHAQAAAQRRPMCGTCTKPLRLCLCGRLRSPPLDTAVGVTVLQHAQEARHPLNSTRVARLGLRNLVVAQVNDVNLRARFVLRTLHAAAARAQLAGEMLDPSTVRAGNCGPLDGLEKARMKNYNDLVGKAGNHAGFGHGGGEISDLGAVHDAFRCCDLDGEADGVEAGHDRDESLGFEKRKMNISDKFGERDKNHAAFWQDEGQRLDHGTTSMPNHGGFAEDSANDFKCQSKDDGRLPCGKIGSCGNGDTATWGFANCGDQDQGVNNSQNVVQCMDLEGGRLDSAMNQMDIFSGLGHKTVDCGNKLQCSNANGVILPMESEKSLFTPSQLGNPVVNGGINHRVEIEVKYQEEGNLVYRLAANRDFHSTHIHHSNGKCKENTEVEAAAGQNWTVKNMDKCTVAYTDKELRISIEHAVKPKIRWLSRASFGKAAVSNGFIAKKIQMQASSLTGEISELEEFSITIPPQSALLFPCQQSVSIDAMDCQVRHLIVLDGTWAKAQRMYHENPWLQLLPHLKLESDRASLYSEVRHEPRAWCLSTIESIVLAMKKLGENADGLHDLLDVFESMIADQRRYKDENWKLKLKSQS